MHLFEIGHKKDVTSWKIAVSDNVNTPIQFLDSTHIIHYKEDTLWNLLKAVHSEVERVQKYSTQVKVPLHYWNFT